MGTAEIYRAVLAVDAIVDALVVDVPVEGADAWMPLFVVLREGASLTDEVVAEIRKRVREDCSPRHVPSEVIAVREVPRTLSGKVLELPVKRILMGTPPDKAAARDSLANPAALDPFVELAAAPRLTVASVIAERLAAARRRARVRLPGRRQEPRPDRGVRAARGSSSCSRTPRSSRGADGVRRGRADRRVPGVVVVGNGPGLASVVNGVAHAWLDRVPLLVISDRYTEAEAATTGHQILDQRALLAPVVKWSATVDASARRESTTRSRRARRPVRPGPPRHAAHGGRRQAGGRCAQQTVPERHDLSHTATSTTSPTALAGAARPVIVAGLEAARDALRRRPRRARRAARRAGAHHVQGQGRDRRGASAVGRDRDRRGDRGAGARRADVILAVGLDPVELLTKPWPWAAPIARARRRRARRSAARAAAASPARDVAASARRRSTRCGSPPTAR